MPDGSLVANSIAGCSRTTWKRFPLIPYQHKIQTVRNSVGTVPGQSSNMQIEDYREECVLLYLYVLSSLQCGVNNQIIFPFRIKEGGL